VEDKEEAVKRWSKEANFKRLELLRSLFGTVHSSSQESRITQTVTFAADL